MADVKIGPHMNAMGFHPIGNGVLWLRRSWHQAFGHPEMEWCDYIPDELYCDRCMSFLFPSPQTLKAHTGDYDA